MQIEIGGLSDPNTISELDDAPIEISNISASFELEGEFDIDQLSQDLENSEYDPDNHRSLIYRSPNIGNFSILLPRKGRVSVAGATSEDDILDGISEFVSKLRELGITSEFGDIRVENIVATGDLGKNVNLNSVVLHLGLECTEYEPEQFPGAVYRTSHGVILLFSSGKVVITAVKSLDQVLQEYQNIRRELEEF